MAALVLPSVRPPIMISSPYPILNDPRSSLNMEKFFSETHLFYIFQSSKCLDGYTRNGNLSKYVAHRLIELVCRKTILLIPRSLLYSHRDEIVPIHEALNYITSCIHFSAVVHEKYGHEVGQAASNEVSELLSKEMAWSPEVIAKVQVILDRYNCHRSVQKTIDVNSIMLCVRVADERPYVSSVTQYVANFYDAFVKHKTETIDMIPMITTVYFPVETVCMGRSFLPMIAMATFNLKELLARHIRDKWKSYLVGYQKFLSSHHQALEDNLSEWATPEVRKQLFPGYV